MSMSSFSLEELAREHARTRLAEAERERLLAQVPDRPGLWRRARQKLGWQLRRRATC